jgi:hypothetical protein
VLGSVCTIFTWIIVLLYFAVKIYAFTNSGH